MANILQREEARKLRNKGWSIKEIADALPANKSTVSYWCRDIELSPIHIQRLEKKQKIESIKALLLASEKKRKTRIIQTKKANDMGRSDVGVLTKRDFFLVGLALYWGEGYKKGNDELGFTNSDPEIIKIFLRWLQEIYHINQEDLILRVGINQIHKIRAPKVLNYWSKLTSIPLNQFTKTSFVKAKVKKHYGNYHEHFGTLRVKVRKGANLRRRILGSISALKYKKAK